MGKRTILLVEPRGTIQRSALTGSVVSHLSTLHQASLLHNAGHRVRIINEDLLERPVGFAELDTDVCCITSETPSIERAHEILRQYKSLRPGGKSILTGSHVTSLPEESVPFADYVITGEPEGAIREVIEEGHPRAIVSGPAIADLDALPMPNCRLMQAFNKIPQVAILTSRDGGRSHSVERILDELKHQPRREACFHDSPFGKEQSFATELLERIIEEGLALRWSAELDLKTARDSAFVELMSHAGCKEVRVQVPALSEAVRESAIQAIETLHDHGIRMTARFTLGADDEPPVSAHETLEFCRHHRLDAVRLSLVTPLPGTKLFQRMENDARLLHRRWSYYDGLHAVFLPRHMTPAELQQELMRSLDSFYGWRSATRELTQGRFRNAWSRFQTKRALSHWRFENSDYLTWLSATFSDARPSVNDGSQAA